MRSPFCFLVLIFFLPVWSSAQEAFHFIADTLQTGSNNRGFTTIRENQFIYVGGQSFDGDNTEGFAYSPSVVKLDTAGNTLWTYSLNKEVDEQSDGTSYGGTFIRQLVGDATAVYAYLGRNDYGTCELWKLDKMTGNLLWKRKINALIGMASANSTQLAITYNNNGFRYDLISKATGQVVMTKLLGPDNTSYTTFAIDTDGAVYITRVDSMIKYTTPDLTTESWRKRLVTEAYITAVSLKDDGFIYIFGDRKLIFSDQIIAGRVSKASGDVLWLSQPNGSNYYTDELITAVQMTDDYIYATSVHTLYGSVFTSFHLWKFNRATGQHIFDVNFHPLWGYNKPGDPPYPYAGALSLDVDSKGSIYVTGYENANDYRTGIWGLCKFRSDGSLVYHGQVFDGAPYQSTYSRGVFNFFFNDRMYYVGELQKNTTPFQCRLYLAATDTGAVFSPYKVKRVKGYYQESSTVKKILPYSAEKYVVYSQLGPRVRVEMKSSRTGNTIWQKEISRPPYLIADKMVITADQQILISAFVHKYYTMRFDYKNAPDSILFIKMDSVGVQTFEKKHNTAQLAQRIFRPVQLYASPDSNNVYAYSMTDDYGHPGSLHFYNIDKAVQAFGSFSNYIASAYHSLRARQNVLVPRTRDTSIHLANYFTTTSKPDYRGYKFDQAYGVSAGFYNPIPNLNLGQQVLVQNMEKFDSASIIFSGVVTASVYSRIGRYRAKQSNVLWIVDLPPGQTVEGISTTANSAYWVGRNKDSLIICRLNGEDGTTRWVKTLAGAIPRQYYIPLDQKYNAVRDQYTICGYIEDSTYITPTQQPFYITVDTLGNILKQWWGTGDYNKNNQLNTIGISQFGQTLIGGAFYKIPYGRSGVLIEADTAIKSMLPPPPPAIVQIPLGTACMGDTVTVIADSTYCEDCTYRWNDLQQTSGPILKVVLGGTYQVTVSNRAGTITATTTVVLKPAPPKPSITLSGASLKSSAVSGNQWYLNDSQIAGATGQNYNPVTAGIYKVQVKENGCSSPLSEGFNFTVTAIIDPVAFGDKLQIVPNPFTDRIITINRLNHPVYLRLYDITGKLLMTTRIPLNSTKELMVNHLDRGMYILLVTDPQANKAMQKQLLKL